MPAPVSKEREFEDRMGDLFNDAPPAQVVEEVVVEPEVIEAEVVVEEVVVDPNVEEDYDADHKPPVVEEEDDIPDESAARKQAKIRGKEAKELKTKLTERELELTREREEKAEIKARLDELTATKLAPEDHEDYKELRETVLSDVRGAARRLTGDAKTLFPETFGKLISSYLAASDAAPENVVEEDEKLAGNIITTLKLSDIPYSDLDADERAALQPTIDKVLDVLERNAGKTKDLQKLHTSLTEKSKTGQLSVGVRQYEARVAKLKPLLDSVGDMAEDLIEANPYAISSVVAKLIKSSPEAAKRAQKATDDALEFVLGPRVLTQKEIDSMEARGESVKEYITERQKLYEVKQGKFAVMLKEGLLTRSLLKETLQKLAKYESERESEESEFDAIRKVTKKKSPPVTEKKQVTLEEMLFGGD